ncbi:MAG: hypothetical protein KGI38_11905 [Thaumarchaeota archaeon]|nr:hypothetical protein [Nitrososphaerota archaeon]
MPTVDHLVYAVDYIKDNPRFRDRASRTVFVYYPKNFTLRQAKAAFRQLKADFHSQYGPASQIRFVEARV